ncbi:darcynin family protein [Granulicella cerasi]|uniref:Darcynin family protein n=1 Tax=Granulicella cerasi TaxID=741063 RepID=A0ABW1Z8J9_9BACT|nr:darcynin family protein [Granulicella cerasi]
MPTESFAPDAVLSEHEGLAGTFHIFMLVKTTRHWLDLPNHEREAFFKTTVFPILRKRPQVKLRYFETEAFSAVASDLLLWETIDLNAWAWIADHLRETLFWDHYFEVVNILPAMEANYPAMIHAA